MQSLNLIRTYMHGLIIMDIQGITRKYSLNIQNMNLMSLQLSFQNIMSFCIRQFHTLF